MDVAPLDPHRQRVGRRGGAGRRHQAAVDEGHPRFLQQRDHPVTIGIEDGLGRVHVRHAAGGQLAQVAEDLEPLAHEEDAPRQLGRQAADVLRALDQDTKAPSFQVLAGESQDLAVVRLAAGRMRLLAEDTPTVLLAHFSPYERHDAGSVPASVSAKATSSGRSTSTTLSMTSP